MSQTSASSLFAVDEVDEAAADAADRRDRAFRPARRSVECLRAQARARATVAAASSTLSPSA